MWKMTAGIGTHQTTETAACWRSTFSELKPESIQARMAQTPILWVERHVRPCVAQKVGARWGGVGGRGCYVGGGRLCVLSFVASEERSEFKRGFGPVASSLCL